MSDLDVAAAAKITAAGAKYVIVQHYGLFGLAFAFCYGRHIALIGA